MSDEDDPSVGDTLGDTLADHRDSSGALRVSELGGRYEVSELIGKGGMGEVRLARDRRIDREVAVKLMRAIGGMPHDDTTLSRFFREARIQGVLEHPAVVPVHDLGIDPDGNPYFVMKRLSGTTLATVLSDPEVKKRWARPALLKRLVDVCLAIEFAHRRDVIHRDLKPANIMFGDFGETYVIDWGLARVVGDRRIESDIAPSLGASGDDDGTKAGDMLGTPGYMSPEQARGEEVDQATDTFSLGCILYEILVGKPGIPRGLPGVQVTLDLKELRPSTKIPDVPPELDALCARATSQDPSRRPGARELADRIQAYLDGDRDHARRRELAEGMARTARAALREPGGGELVRVDADAGDGADEARAIAMREAGRALVLDPENSTALGVLSYLLFESPGPIPAEALADADLERGLARQRVLKWARGAFAGLAAICIGLLFVPLHHVWPLLVALGAVTANGFLSHWLALEPRPMKSPYYLLFMAFMSLAVAAASIVLGPLFLIPLFVVGAIGGIVAQPLDYPAWFIVSWLWAPMLVVIGLEVGGVLPSTFEFRDNGIYLTSWVFDLTPTIAAVLLAAGIAVQTINSTLVAVFQRQAQESAQNRVHANLWHLQRMLPPASRDSTVTGRVKKSG